MVSHRLSAVDLKVADEECAPGVLEKDPGPATIEFQDHFVVVVGDVPTMRHIPVEFADRLGRCILQRHILVESNESGQKPQGHIVFGQGLRRRCRGGRGG